MDNSTRSERSRKTAIQAAFTIIARDGPGRLTFDAISRESGISKGGLMHQFHTKGSVLKALLEHQAEYFESFFRDYLATIDDAKPEATLLAQIATARESTTQQHSVALAILAALVEDPELLSTVRESDVKRVKHIKAEAFDPELALLRWSAARGLALTALLGLCPFSDKERGRLFDRLLDEGQWPSSPDLKVKKPRSARSSRSASHSDQSA
jgi:AcrR family transcriptional regulator